MYTLTNSKRRALAVALGALAALVVAIAPGAVAGAASSGGVGSYDGGGTTGDDGSQVNERYSKIWYGNITQAEKRWAHRTADCESGGDPDAIGGGGMYRGAFQFMRSTWKAAPKSPGGDPIAYPYRTQAVVAVLLKRRDGAGHWPNCGR